MSLDRGERFSRDLIEDYRELREEQKTADAAHLAADRKPARGLSASIKKQFELGRIKREQNEIARTIRAIDPDAL